jgi:hypothetical protein
MGALLVVVPSDRWVSTTEALQLATEARLPVRGDDCAGRPMTTLLRRLNREGWLIRRTLDDGSHIWTRTPTGDRATGAA